MPLQQARQPAPVLGHRGAVEAELVLERVQAGGGRRVSEDGVGRIPRAAPRSRRR